MKTELPELLSNGYMTAQVGVSMTTLRKAIEARGIEPATTINGIAHYSGEDFERIREHLRHELTRPT